MPVVPKLRRQRRKGKPDSAFIEVDGRRVGLGVWGSDESGERYLRAVAELKVGGTAAAHFEALTVVELTTRFFGHLERTYVQPETGSTPEPDHYRQALKQINRLYGRSRADAFGPLQLRAVREAMIENGWSRTYINAQCARIKRVWKWAVSEGIVPPSTFHGLQVIDGLRRGRTDAVEPVPIRPVDDALVDATMEHLTPTLRALVGFIRHTGCRVGEACRLKMSAVDMGGPEGRPWLYKVVMHKGTWRAGQRVIVIGPKAKEAIRPFLNTVGHVFSAKQSTAERMAVARAARMSKVQPSQIDRSKPNPQKTPGDHYTPGSLYQAIAKACQQAFPLPSDIAAGSGEAREWVKDHSWSCLQLRHAYATRVRRDHGLGAAQVLLGHSKADITQVYAERDLEKAIEVAKLIG